MPSSSNRSATNESTAIVCEQLSKSNKITIGDNGITNNSTKIPAHKLYGDTSMPSPLLTTHPKVEQTDSEKLISKQNDNYCNSTSAGNSSIMSRMPDIRLRDEVLVQLENDTFYLGIIKNIRSDLFLIRFANCTEKWTSVSKITQVNVKQENAMCVICKEYDEIVQVCSQCRRGYHKKCLKSSKTDDCSTAWYCPKCAASPECSEQQTDKVAKITETPNSCYCGEKGDWFMQMLQCARCLQWFHAKCIKCLSFPLYFGDRYGNSNFRPLVAFCLKFCSIFSKTLFHTFCRFYLFACARCNHGVEFLRRLHMNIEEVVHLLLFNLTLQFRKRYYNLTNVIYPYARDNWLALQLPPKVRFMNFIQLPLFKSALFICSDFLLFCTAKKYDVERC